jgi:hypothetical protein
VIEPQNPPRLIEALFRSGDAPELPNGGRAGLSRAHSVADKPIHFQSEMSLNLVMEVFFGALSPEPHEPYSLVP